MTLANARHQKEIRGLDPTVLDLFERYDWPGNIRELQNEIERAIVLTPSGETIKPAQLSTEVRAGAAKPEARPVEVAVSGRVESAPPPAVKEAPTPA